MWASMADQVVSIHLDIDAIHPTIAMKVEAHV
jgi:hypothetical protein